MREAITFGVRGVGFDVIVRDGQAPPIEEKYAADRDPR
jgi:hypothetical protein